MLITIYSQSVAVACPSAFQGARTCPSSEAAAAAVAAGSQYNSAAYHSLSVAIAAAEDTFAAAFEVWVAADSNHSCVVAAPEKGLTAELSVQLNLIASVVAAVSEAYTRCIRLESISSDPKDKRLTSPAGSEDLR